MDICTAVINNFYYEEALIRNRYDYYFATEQEPLETFEREIREERQGTDDVQSLSVVPVGPTDNLFFNRKLNYQQIFGQKINKNATDEMFCCL